MSVDPDETGLEYYDEDDDSWYEQFWYNSVDGTWYVPFSYGDLSGEAKCIDTGGDGETWANLPSNTAGKYCWLRMLSPNTSEWYFHKAYSSNSDCKANCTEDAAWFVFDGDNAVLF